VLLILLLAFAAFACWHRLPWHKLPCLHCGDMRLHAIEIQLFVLWRYAPALFVLWRYAPELYRNSFVCIAAVCACIVCILAIFACLSSKYLCLYCGDMRLHAEHAISDWCGTCCLMIFLSDVAISVALLLLQIWAPCAANHGLAYRPAQP
jgi:hypothetical protein